MVILGIVAILATLVAVVQTAKLSLERSDKRHEMIALYSNIYPDEARTLSGAQEMLANAQNYVALVGGLDRSTFRPVDRARLEPKPSAEANAKLRASAIKLCVQVWGDVWDNYESFDADNEHVMRVAMAEEAMRACARLNKREKLSDEADEVQAYGILSRAAGRL